MALLLFDVNFADFFDFSSKAKPKRAISVFGPSALSRTIAPRNFAR